MNVRIYNNTHFKLEIGFWTSCSKVERPILDRQVAESQFWHAFINPNDFGVVAGCAIVTVPEAIGSEQRWPVKDPWQCCSIPRHRRAGVEPKSTDEHQQQSDASAQVRDNRNRDFRVFGSRDRRCSWIAEFAHWEQIQSF